MPAAQAWRTLRYSSTLKILAPSLLSQKGKGWTTFTPPAAAPFRRFRGLVSHCRSQAETQVGSIYGRRIYETMRYWDDDHPEWGEPERAFAAAWQKQTKWVVSRRLKTVGPNASLIDGDLGTAIRALKAEHDGEIEVAGPNLAASVTDLGLIDEYRIYLHPTVLGHGTPYFAGSRPPLRLIAHDLIDEDVIRLRYVPV